MSRDDGNRICHPVLSFNSCVEEVMKIRSKYAVMFIIMLDIIVFANKYYFNQWLFFANKDSLKYFYISRDEEN